MDIEELNDNKITHAEKKLLVYHCLYFNPEYDKPEQKSPDKITKKDVDKANKYMGARSPERRWKRLYHKNLVGFPHNDLITMPE
jgi:hypothetical protein